MATFAKSTFSAASYAAFRPSYPSSIYSKLLAYHEGPQGTLLDLGCGHGLISRYLSPHFSTIHATDPSPKMIAQAIADTPSPSNITYTQASAEHLQFVEDGSVDMVVAGQAAHWFDYGKVWPELCRKLRKGGTVAWWGYKDNFLVDYPRATAVTQHYCYGEDQDTMGAYWEQPGRQILRDLYKDINVPEDLFGDIQRITYEPQTKGRRTGEGECLMSRQLKLGELDGYWRTFSAYHAWEIAHPHEQRRERGGKGDVLDRMWDEVREVEPEIGATGEAWRDLEVETEWGSVILLARKR